MYNFVAQKIALNHEQCLKQAHYPHIHLIPIETNHKMVFSFFFKIIIFKINLKKKVSIKNIKQFFFIFLVINMFFIKFKCQEFCITIVNHVIKLKFLIGY